MKNINNISQYRRNIGNFQAKRTGNKPRVKPVINSDLLILLSKLQSSTPTEKSSKQIIAPTRKLRAMQKARSNSSANNSGTTAIGLLFLVLLSVAVNANAQLNQTSIPVPSSNSINTKVTLPLHIESLIRKSTNAELDKLIGNNCPPDKTISTILSNRFTSNIGSGAVTFFGKQFKEARKEGRWIQFYVDTVLCSDIKITIEDCEIISVEHELAQLGEYLPLSNTLTLRDCREFELPASAYTTVKHEAWHAWQTLKKNPSGYKQKGIRSTAPYNIDDPNDEASYRAAMAADRKNLSQMIKEAETLALADYSPQLQKINAIFESNKEIYERDKIILNFLKQMQERIDLIIDTYTTSNKVMFEAEYEMRYTLAKNTINNFLDDYITAENFRKLSEPSIANLHKLENLVMQGIRRCEQYLHLNEKMPLTEKERTILTEIEYSLVKPLPLDQVSGLKAFYYKIRKQGFKLAKDRTVRANFKKLIEETHYNLQVLKEACSQLHISRILDHELEANILQTDTTMFPVIFPNTFAFHFEDLPLVNENLIESSCKF